MSTNDNTLFYRFVIPLIFGGLLGITAIKHFEAKHFRELYREEYMRTYEWIGRLNECSGLESRWEALAEERWRLHRELDQMSRDMRACDTERWVQRAALRMQGRLP